mgnify:CR=1 FL=1
MNIFYVHETPSICAQQHVDKHVVKMILEYAQLLSTAHRVLDGVSIVGKSKTGRKQTRYVLSDDRDSVLYNATHLNHPSAKWTRHSACNYRWLFKLWIELMREYNYRYGKIHASARLIPHLKNLPKNIQELGFLHHGEQCLKNTNLIALNLTILLNHTVHITMVLKQTCLSGKIDQHQSGFYK